MTNKPATLPQLIALRDALLRWKDKDAAAAAADNLIDILSRAAIPSEWYAICPQCKTGYDERFTNCLVCNSQLIRPYVEPDGCGNDLERSPYISGGEVIYPQPVHGNDVIPF